MLEPLDFMARLAALVPPPKMHLTRYHGVFAPHSKLRAAVTAAHRGIGAPQPLPAADPAKPPTPRHVAMTWARRLKRVFGIEIEACVRCGGEACDHRQHRGAGGDRQYPCAPGDSRS
ncbi:MAG: transposase [Gammaproteobacteria bacterium]|nr:transposase [Gammaproteobacteria bacterium]